MQQQQRIATVTIYDNKTTGVVRVIPTRDLITAFLLKDVTQNPWVQRLIFGLFLEEDLGGMDFFVAESDFL